MAPDIPFLPKAFSIFHKEPTIMERGLFEE
jgi:hypothetical protein